MLLGWSLAAVGAVCFSAKAIVAKFHYLQGLDSLDVIALRMAFAFPLFVALGLRELWRVRPDAEALGARDIALLIVLGLLGYYLSSLLDFWGLEYVPVSLERLLLFLNPTFVLLIGWLAFGRRVSARQWSAMAISYVGIAIVLAETLRFDSDGIVFGSTLVLGAALSYAIYLAVSGELIRRVGALRLVAAAMCVSSVAALLHYALARDATRLLDFDAPVYALAGVNAVFCTLLPVTFTMAAVARIGAGRTAQMSVIGPVSLVFLGHWLLGEAISAMQIAGTAVVLAGIWVLTRPGANSVPLPVARAERSDAG